MQFTKYFLICFLLTTSFSFSQIDTTSNNSTYQFKPRLAGGQVESVIHYFTLGFGGIIDLDLISKKSNNNDAFGLRFAIEYYTYFNEMDGSPFTDYCIYGRYTKRLDDFWISFLAGLSYHDYNHFFDDEILFRAGLELKYNLLDKYAGVLFKVSSSFQENSTYTGIGIFLSYYE